MKRVARSSLLLALLATPAYGEPIGVLSGQFEHEVGSLQLGGPLVLTGERGFTFRSVDRFSLTFLGWTCLPSPAQCVPGATIGMTAALAPAGIATLEGIALDVAAGDLWLQLNSSVVLPPLAPTGIVTGTFRVSDSFNRLIYIDAAGQPQTTGFLGLGDVTLFLRRNEQLPTLWSVERATYEFSPVPEPATLLLVSTGLATMTLGRRHRRRKPQPEGFAGAFTLTATCR